MFFVDKAAVAGVVWAKAVMMTMMKAGGILVMGDMVMFLFLEFLAMVEVCKGKEGVGTNCGNLLSLKGCWPCDLVFKL